jgi:hypothetical protein
MKTEREVRDEIRQIRERVRGLSGFWIGEASEAIYALEWALGKREPPPSEDLGRARGGREKIAASLLKLAENAPAPKLRAVPKPNRPAPAPRGKAPPARRSR